MSSHSPDSVLLVGFGAPSDPADAREFVAGVLEGRGGSPQRVEEVASHYERLGGSPYNEKAAELAGALQEWLSRQGRNWPVLLGMRYWHPRIRTALETLARGGARHTLAVALSAFVSSSGRASTLEQVEREAARCVEGCPDIRWLEPWPEDPAFARAWAARVDEVRTRAGISSWEGTALVFTAHSIPKPVAARSPYVDQFEETARGIAALLEWTAEPILAYQSASTGPFPWLGPDIEDCLRGLRGGTHERVLVAPIGFLFDHVEVLYDLDTNARATAEAVGLKYLRASTIGSHPAFVEMLGRRLLQMGSDTP